MEDRLDDVLAQLLVEPDAALRAARRALVQRVRWQGDPALRRELAEHYRALGALDQAARWGIVETGWARASELRALRLTLIAEGPSAVRDYLGLRRDDPVPPAVADLALPPQDADRSDADGCLSLVIALIAGAWALGSLLMALLDIARGDRPQTWMLVSGLVAAACCALAVWGIARAETRFTTARDAAISDADRAAIERLQGRERRTAERAAVGTAMWAGSPLGDSARSRQWLVDEARRWGDRAGAARWGLLVEGLSTGPERDALVAVLRRGDDPVEALARLSRRPWDLPFSRDELDVLRRAGADDARVAAFHTVDAPHVRIRWLGRCSAPLAIAAVALPLVAVVVGALVDDPVAAVAARAALVAVPTLLSASLVCALAGDGQISRRAMLGLTAAGVGLSAVVAVSLAR
ncbi:hypothetical protein ABIB37_002480 [Agrococcus sp. UYP10]|uniref:hypothetical protein n=1 Tax=Agrococcus sp. UYP10 TaxID=1756355 RepID=UPI003390C0FC